MARRRDVRPRLTAGAEARAGLIAKQLDDRRWSGVWRSPLNPYERRLAELEAGRDVTCQGWEIRDWVPGVESFGTFLLTGDGEVAEVNVIPAAGDPALRTAGCFYFRRRDTGERVEVRT